MAKVCHIFGSKYSQWNSWCFEQFSSYQKTLYDNGKFNYPSIFRHFARRIDVVGWPSGPEFDYIIFNYETPQKFFKFLSKLAYNGAWRSFTPAKKHAGKYVG